jgi:hypothetical protein
LLETFQKKSVLFLPKVSTKKRNLRFWKEAYSGPFQKKRRFFWIKRRFFLFLPSKKTTFYPFLFFGEKKEQIEDFFGTASSRSKIEDFG